MLMESDPSVAVTVRKLVMVSLMEIFKDVAPTYRIRPLTPEEKASKVTSACVLEWAPPSGPDSLTFVCSHGLQVKKDTQLIRDFEEGLVSQYKFYLEDLEQTIKGTQPQ